MKKILAFMLCAALALMCTGCAGENDGMIEWINLESPTLLAFQVSDDHEGGVYIYSAAEMDEILAALTEALESGETDSLQSVIDSLSAGGPIEGAST